MRSIDKAPWFGASMASLICLCVLTPELTADETTFSSSRRNAALVVAQPEQDDAEDDAPILPPTVVEEEAPETPEPPPEPEPEPEPPAEPPLLDQPAFEPFSPDYQVDTAPIGTRTDVPISETPISLQVVPQAVIRDQAAQQLEDIYVNVSGVNQAGNTLNAQSVVRPIIRGFESPVFFRNGMRVKNVGSVELLNIESVEILKGPSSVLYGALEVGGILNYTTKKPLPVPYYYVNQQFGSYDRFRTTLDYNEPLNEDGTVLFRLNGAFVTANSFRDFIDLDRGGIAPSISFRPDESTEWTIDFSWSRETLPYDSGVPVGFNDEVLVPDSTFFGDPTLAGRDLEDFFLGSFFAREVNENLTFRNQILMQQVNAKNEAIRHRGVRGTPGAEELRIRYQNEDRTEESFQMVTDAVLRFGPENFENVVVAGVDFSYEESNFARFRQNLPNVLITPNPNVQFTPPANQPQQSILEEQVWIATYLQDQITVNDRLHILLGGRFDYVENEGSRDGVASPSQFDDAVTGRVGVLYELTEGMSPFFSVSESFLPQFAGTLDRVGNPLQPETGFQYEGGIKMQSSDGKLLATLVGYYIEKDNVAVFDQEFFNDTGEIAFLPGVSQRSQGFEFDISGELSDQIKIIGNYSYTDARTLADATNPDQVGQRLGNVPFHLARFWVTYTGAENTFWEGFGIGGGPRYQSNFLAQFDTSVELPAFTFFDAGIWYRQPTQNAPGWRFQLNFINLFNEEYFVRASDQSIVHPGTPFSVIGSVGLEY